MLFSRGIEDWSGQVNGASEQTEQRARLAPFISSRAEGGRGGQQRVWQLLQTVSLGGPKQEISPAGSGAQFSPVAWEPHIPSSCGQKPCLMEQKQMTCSFVTGNKQVGPGGGRRRSQAQGRPSPAEVRHCGKAFSGPLLGSPRSLFLPHEKSSMKLGKLVCQCLQFTKGFHLHCPTSPPPLPFEVD